MTDFFVDDSVLGGGDDGTDWDTNAFNTGSNSGIRTAMQTGNAVYDPGDKIWIRRTSGYDQAVAALGHIAATADGTPSLPVEFIGWPRAAILNTTIASADWTKGNTTVDNIIGIACNREAHQARYAIAPNGYQYLITRVIDPNTIIIDREYAGSTITGTDGKFQIEADEDYDTRPNVGALRATWDADAHNVPVIDFNNEAFSLIIDTDVFLVFRNMEFRDSDRAGGILTVDQTQQLLFTGILVIQNSNKACLASTRLSGIIFKRFTAEGSEAGNAQKFVSGEFFPGSLTLIDGAIYGMGDIGIGAQGNTKLININVGVEIANGDDDISVALHRSESVWGRDVKLGGTNGYVDLVVPYEYYAPDYPTVRFENYQKVLGDHKSFHEGGTFERTAISGETPNKKLSDFAMKIAPNREYTYKYEEGQCLILEHEYQLNAGANTVKYWLYNDVGVTMNNGDARADIYLVAEYVDSYGDTSKYTITKAYSTEHTIAQAADADDWDFLSVSMTLATPSKVRVRLLISYYDLIGDIFIDEKPLVNGRACSDSIWGYGLLGTSIEHPSINDVEDGVVFNYGTEIGNFEAPAENDVEDGEGYGANGIEYLGNFEAPSESDVEDGVGYGSNGAEYEGNFEAPSEDDVEKDVQYGASGVEFIGNFEAPSEGDVKTGVTYGASGTEFTGTKNFIIEEPIAITVEQDGVIDVAVEII